MPGPADTANPIIPLTAQQRKGILDRWIAALRSSKYDKCEKALCQRKHNNPESPEFKYCVLGVLCDVFVTQVKTNKYMFEWDTGGMFDHNHARIVIRQKDQTDIIEYNYTYIPHIIFKSLGLQNKFGVLTSPEGECISLAELNDIKKISFNELANLIESSQEYTNLKDEVS